MRTEFQTELDELETDFQDEGLTVLRALRGTLKALEQQDVELANEVISFDDEVDDRYHKIEKKMNTSKDE